MNLKSYLLCFLAGRHDSLLLGNDWSWSICGIIADIVGNILPFQVSVTQLSLL